METKIITAFSNIIDYGIAGGVVVLFAIIVILLLRWQKEERNEWRQSFELHSRQQHELQKDTNTALKDLTVVVRTLSERVR